MIIISSQTNEIFPIRLLEAEVHDYFTKEADRDDVM